MEKFLQKLSKSETLLRIGVSFAFIYPAVSAWFNPYSWVGYFPGFLDTAVAPHQIEMLHLFGLVEIATAVWILFGRRIFVPAFGATVLLFLIIIFNLNQMDVLFRDIPILLMAVALLLESKRKQ